MIFTRRVCRLVACSVWLVVDMTNPLVEFIGSVEFLEFIGFRIAPTSYGPQATGHLPHVLQATSNKQAATWHAAADVCSRVGTHTVGAGRASD